MVQKLQPEIKSKFKINEDPKILKEFESFYSNLLERLSLVKIPFDQILSKKYIT